MNTAQVYQAHLQALRSGLQSLPDKPEETPESCLHALWHLAAGQRLSAQAATEQPLPDLDATAQARLSDLLTQRLQGKPLAHLTGRQRFMGLDMLASPQALIPRRETELLARTALTLLPDNSTARVIDVCTGCANVAAALAHARPGIQLEAADLSADAIALAHDNLHHLGLAPRAQLHVSDLLDAFQNDEHQGRIDLITCNPPYISTARRTAMAAEIAEHEPSLAFDGGALGVRILQRLVREAPDLLRDCGWLVFEVGAGQGKAVADRLRADGRYAQITPVTDAQGETRVLKAQRLPRG